jgi:hypothetical protein
MHPRGASGDLHDPVELGPLLVERRRSARRTAASRDRGRGGHVQRGRTSLLDWLRFTSSFG